MKRTSATFDERSWTPSAAPMSMGPKADSADLQPVASEKSPIRPDHSHWLDVRFVIRPPASTALDKPRGLWDLVDVVTENNLIRAIVTWISPMPFPFAETVALTDLQRAQLESLVRAGSTPQALVFRCRLILRAADRDHPTNLQIAAEFDCNRHTVAGWRNRYLSNGLAGLQDAPRSGRPRRFSPLGEARSDQFGEQHNRTARLSRHPLVAG
jgi:hypothetical protein